MRVVSLAFRPLLTSPLIERDMLAVAPAMIADFEQDLAERGAEAASVSCRVAGQLADEPRAVTD